MHEKQLETPEGQRLLTAIREVCRSLPEVCEVVDGFGHTTFKVRGKSFLIGRMGEQGTAVSLKSDLVNQAFLVARGPYYRTPYIGRHGWITLDRPLGHDWAEVRELIVDAWYLAAPKRLARQGPRESPGG
jgi:predicted DNA-binding protein (MmcQ/YjbR family)